MECPNCKSKLREVKISIHGAESKAISYQCPKCDYFEVEQKSAIKLVDELRETHLKIKQKIVKLSQDRLGLYFNRDVIRSLSLKNGEDIYVSVPDKKHIVLELKN